MRSRGCHIRWPVTVIPQVFFKTSHANVKLHVRTWTMSTCARGVSRSHVELKNYSSPCANVKLHVRAWNSTWERATWSFTFARRTPRSHINHVYARTSTMSTCGVRTWECGVSRSHLECKRETPRACARTHSWRANVEFYVWSSEFDVHTWSSTCERETPRAHVHVDMVDVRTWSFTFAREVLKILRTQIQVFRIVNGFDKVDLGTFLS